MFHGKHQVKAPSFKAMEEQFLKGLAHWFGYYIESDSTAAFDCRKVNFCNSLSCFSVFDNNKEKWSKENGFRST